MRLHANAALSLRQRRRLGCRVIDEGWSIAEAAAAAEVSARTAAMWAARYRGEGEAGLRDRSSAPRRIPHRTPADRVRLIELLRRLRMTSVEIAASLAMPLSTISAVLGRLGLGRLSRLDPPEPPNRYERRRAGELLHIDVKKLGRISRVGHRISGDRRSRTRGAGWEYVHVCVDDATRLAYVEVLSDEKATTICGFLRRAVGFYRRHGVRVERVMTDNGSGYRSARHAVVCRSLGLRHLRTRPYRPRTNGKAERFIRTMLAGWAYGAVYASSLERRRALDGWLWTYNHHRPHAALGRLPPIARLNEQNNVAGIYT